ncbi:hypothetical protein ACVWZR_002012 [Bradyrhizobium sp. i1.3.1]
MPRQNGVATEAAGDHQKLYDPPREREIGHVTSIPALDASGNRSAKWTLTYASRRSDRNNRLIAQHALSTTNPLGTRLERWSACCMALILPNQNARYFSNCIKSDGVERPFEPASKVPNVVA